MFQLAFVPYAETERHYNFFSPNRLTKLASILLCLILIFLKLGILYVCSFMHMSLISSNKTI